MWEAHFAALKRYMDGEGDGDQIVLQLRLRHIATVKFGCMACNQRQAKKGNGKENLG